MLFFLVFVVICTWIARCKFRLITFYFSFGLPTISGTQKYPPRAGHHFGLRIFIWLSLTPRQGVPTISTPSACASFERAGFGLAQCCLCLLEGRSLCSRGHSDEQTQLVHFFPTFWQCLLAPFCMHSCFPSSSRTCRPWLRLTCPL